MKRHTPFLSSEALEKAGEGRELPVLRSFSEVGG